MKKLLYIACLTVILSHPLIIDASEKIVMVDVLKVFQQLPDPIIASKKLESEFKSRAQELQKKENKFACTRCHSSGSFLFCSFFPA